MGWLSAGGVRTPGADPGPPRSKAQICKNEGISEQNYFQRCCFCDSSDLSALALDCFSMPFLLKNENFLFTQHVLLAIQNLLLLLFSIFTSNCLFSNYPILHKIMLRICCILNPAHSYNNRPPKSKNKNTTAHLRIILKEFYYLLEKSTVPIKELEAKLHHLDVKEDNATKEILVITLERKNKSTEGNKRKQKNSTATGRKHLSSSTEYTTTTELRSDVKTLFRYRPPKDSLIIIGRKRNGLTAVVKSTPLVCCFRRKTKVCRLLSPLKFEASNSDTFADNACQAVFQASAFIRDSPSAERDANAASDRRLCFFTVCSTFCNAPVIIPFSAKARLEMSRQLRLTGTDRLHDLKFRLETLVSWRMLQLSVRVRQQQEELMLLNSGLRIEFDGTDLHIGIISRNRRRGLRHMQLSTQLGILHCLSDHGHGLLAGQVGSLLPSLPSLLPSVLKSHGHNMDGKFIPGIISIIRARNNDPFAFSVLSVKVRVPYTRVILVLHGRSTSITSYSGTQIHPLNATYPDGSAPTDCLQQIIYKLRAMTLTTSFPKKRSLHNRTSDQKRFLSIPFCLCAGSKGKASASLFVDLHFPFGSSVAGAEIRSISSNATTSCSIFAQLLDNSGRVAGPPFAVGITSQNDNTIRLTLPIQDTQKIRFILHAANDCSPELIFTGKLLLLSGGVSVHKRMKSKLSKWRSGSISLAKYANKQS
eukprot:gene1005-598_t